MPTVTREELLAALPHLSMNVRSVFGVKSIQNLWPNQHQRNTNGQQPAKTSIWIIFNYQAGVEGKATFYPVDPVPWAHLGSAAGLII